MSVAVARDYVPARPKNPLRLIVSRFPAYDALYPSHPEQESLTGWLDTLECGHQFFAMNVGLYQPSLGAEQGAKRHRCIECAIAQVKKPAQSVKVVKIGRAIPA